MILVIVKDENGIFNSGWSGLINDGVGEGGEGCGFVEEVGEVYVV